MTRRVRFPLTWRRRWLIWYINQIAKAYPRGDSALIKIRALTCLMLLSAVLLLFGFRSVPVDRGGKRGAGRTKQ